MLAGKSGSSAFLLGGNSFSRDLVDEKDSAPIIQSRQFLTVLINLDESEGKKKTEKKEEN